MDSFKISNYSNITFRSIKNIGRLTRAIKLGSGAGMIGITYQMLKSDRYDKSSTEMMPSNDINAKKYNEKEAKPSNSLIEDIMNRIKNLEKGAKEKLDTGKDEKPWESTLEGIERLPDFRESADDDDDYYGDIDGMYHPLIELADLKKETAIIKNKQLKKIAETICKKEQLYKSILFFIRDIDSGLENITDTKILKELRSELKRLADTDYAPFNYNDREIGVFAYFSALNDIADLVDVYNTMNGRYSRYKAADIIGESIYIENSKPTAYIRHYRRVAPKSLENFITALNQDVEKKHPLVADFESFTKTEALELFSHKEEQLDYMYEKYYLSKITDVPAKKLCKEIYHTYGVRILLSNKTNDIQKALKVIKKELENWTKVSGGKAKFPQILDLNSCDIEYDKASAYVDARGNMHHHSANINTYNTLRHELLHMNQPTWGARFTKDAEFAKLINSIIPSKQIEINGKNKMVLDWENCKYREEFLKAGIGTEHIKYAYTNRNEFLAVAAEGDLNQCSPEFREILIKIGMPEYVFDLPIDDITVETNVERVKDILKKHPRATYDKLVQYIEKEKAQELSPEEKLFNTLFGKNRK